VTVPDLPNIVLVVFDTARWDRFGCYGYARPTTLTVDALADEGMRVETMIANGPWTPPSHASLFTGLYPSEHGCEWGSGPKMRDSVDLTLAEWLRGSGYSTLCATSNGLISERTGLTRGFDSYVYRMDLERGYPRVARRIRRLASGADSGGTIINRWLRDELKDVPRPVFLFVNYRECHWSYAPPQRFIKQVGGVNYGPIKGLGYRARVAAHVGPWEAVARAGEHDLDVYSTLYDAELATADDHLRHLLEILSETGHLPSGETIVIVTSDHGEHIGEHGLADHQASLDDHLIRVPFVSWGPGLIGKETVDGVHEFVDVFPSLTSLLDRDRPTVPLRGRDDLFSSSRTNGAEQYAFAEWKSWPSRKLAILARHNPSFDFQGLNRDLVCIRDRRFKLVRSSDGTEVLYDLAEDPAEESADPQADASTVARLRHRLDATVESLSSSEAVPAGISEQEEREIEQRLSELGYI
jgi:arylsulfatase A-like enzyme